MDGRNVERVREALGNVDAFWALLDERGDRLIRWNSFQTRAEALEAAGLSELAVARRSVEE